MKNDEPLSEGQNMLFDLEVVLVVIAYYNRRLTAIHLVEFSFKI